MSVHRNPGISALSATNTLIKHVSTQCYYGYYDTSIATNHIWIVAKNYIESQFRTAKAVQK